jgi:hypothetical protein
MIARELARFGMERGDVGAGALSDTGPAPITQPEGPVWAGA